MYSKLIFTIDGKEIVFEAHEIVKIAQKITTGAPDERVLIPLEGYFEQLMKNANPNDLDFINGAIDIYITIPLHIGGLCSIGHWLYTARQLRQGHDYEPRYGWWMNVGGRLLLIKNRYYGYQLDIEDETNNPTAVKKAWEKHKDTTKHFLLYKYQDRWHVYGSNYREELTDQDITDPVKQLAPDLSSSNFPVHEEELLEIVIGSNYGLGHRQDYYISDHGFVTDIIAKTREIVFGCNWVNPNFVMAIIQSEKLISATPDKKLPRLKRKLMQSIATATMAELKAFHPDKTEAELLEMRRLCAEDPQYAEDNWEEIRGNSQYILHALAKKYCEMRTVSPGFDSAIFEDFGYEMGSNLVKRLVMLELMREINRGKNTGLIRPLYSYGNQYKGDAYHEFERSVQAYFKRKDAVSPAELAIEMRSILSGGLIFHDPLSFLPNLTVAWFTAEAVRNDVSIMTGLMLLDMLESEMTLNDPRGFNWYTWQNALIHPLKSVGEKNCPDLYGKEVGIDRFGGAHSMTHGGSVADTLIPIHPCQLRLIDGPVSDGWNVAIKIGALIIIEKESNDNYWLHYTDDLKTHDQMKIADPQLITMLNKQKFSGELYDKTDLRQPFMKMLKNAGSRLHFDAIKLPTARQKEGSLIIHWLWVKLLAEQPSVLVVAIPAHSPQGKFTEPHSYDEIGDENNSSTKLRWAENKVKRAKSEIHRLETKNDMQRANSEREKLQEFERTRKRLEIKIALQKKYIEPLLRLRLSTLNNLLPCANIRQPKFTKSYAQLVSKNPGDAKPVNNPHRMMTNRNAGPISASLHHFGVFSSQEQGDDIPDAVKHESIRLAEGQGLIGPREIPEWELEDVEDIGNCFYDAAVDQMELLNHPFIAQVPKGTLARDSLRLHLQGEEFQDKEWANDELIDSFVKKFPLILAIVDTRSPEAGFVCYYMGEDGDVLTNALAALPLPNLPIIRLAATGNHFLSVRSHPELMQGTINDSYNAFPYYHQPSMTFAQQVYEGHIIENRHNDPQIQRAYDERFGLIMRP